MEERSQSQAGADTPRARLIAALVTSIKEKGYRETTVADIVRIARTSRRTFYEHFSDRADCFRALFVEFTSARMQEIVAAVDPSGQIDDQIERAIDAFIDGESMDPDLQRAFIRELPGLPQAAEIASATVERYADMLVGLTVAARERHPEILRPLSRDVAVVLVGGLRELLVISIQQDRDLRELRDSALEVVRAILASLKVPLEVAPLGHL